MRSPGNGQGWARTTLFSRLSGLCASARWLQNKFNPEARTLNYDLLKQSLPYRALLGLGAPLTGEDFEQIQRDAKLYCALWMVNRAAVDAGPAQLPRLSESYLRRN